MAPAVRAWIPAVAGRLGSRRLEPVRMRPTGTQANPRWRLQSNGSESVRWPRHRARRMKASTPAPIRLAPVTRLCGAATQAASAMSNTARATRSTASCPAGMQVSPRCFSQFPVKLGMMRPPTRLIRSTATAIARRCPAGPVDAWPAASAWINAFARSSPARTIVIGRLRQLRAAMISRRTAARSKARKARSSAAATPAPISPEAIAAARPISHRAKRRASGKP